MATREAVYEQFGRAAHFAQLLEHYVGTALLAIDALDTQSYLRPDADAYLRLKSEIDAKTLGRTLAKIKARLQLSDDIEAQFSNALEKRNALIHGFFAPYALKFIDESGRDEMLAELSTISEDLNQAWRSAEGISSLLIHGVHMLHELHRAQPKA